MAGRRRPQDVRPPDAILMPGEDGLYHDEDIRAFVDYVKGLHSGRADRGAGGARPVAPATPERPELRDPDA